MHVGERVCRCGQRFGCYRRTKRYCSNRCRQAQYRERLKTAPKGVE